MTNKNYIQRDENVVLVLPVFNEGKSIYDLLLNVKKCTDYFLYQRNRELGRHASTLPRICSKNKQCHVTSFYLVVQKFI